MAEESQDDSQKTEEPTQKKLDDSHKKGQVASSREINNWFMLLGGTILVLMVGPSVAGELKLILVNLLSSVHDKAIGGAGVGQVLRDAIHDVAGVMVVPFGILALLALLASLIQHTPVLSLESIKPKLEKISPAKGAKKLFSSRSLVEFLKGLLKLIIVGSIATMVTVPEFRRLTQMPLMNLGDVTAFLWSVSGRLLVAVMAVMTVIAALDFLYQKMQHTKQLRMSRQEIKDEMKQSDGDPIVKARLRQIRTERARSRMMAAVPESTVVITNPTHFAVALRYVHDEMEVPEVVAKGADLIAKRIREIAQENGVPIVENPPLARALFATTKIGQTIPSDHYRAVAEVIGYVMRLKPRKGATRARA